GAYSVVVPDGPPTAPPAAVVGSALRPAPASAVDADLLTASGEVIPPVSLASTNPVEVTARARLRVTHTGDALPSGTVLEAVIRESYRLSDGTERTPPPYVTTLALYRHPGETNVARVG